MRCPNGSGGIVAPPEGTITEVGPAELERLSGLTTPNQVVAVFEKTGIFSARS